MLRKKNIIITRFNLRFNSMPERRCTGAPGIATNQLCVFIYCLLIPWILLVDTVTKIDLSLADRQILITIFGKMRAYKMCRTF